MLLSWRHDALKKFIQLQPASNFQSQPWSTKLSAVFNSNSRRIDFDPLSLSRCLVYLFKQRQLLWVARCP